MSLARPLTLEAIKYQALKERLELAFPEIDNETLADTLEGITNLHEMIAAVIRSALVDEALHCGLRFRLDEMKMRSSRLEERGAKKRRLALEAMIDAGLTKLELPDFTASTRAGSPSLLVASENLIPEPYWLPQPSKLNRQALLSELKQGSHIPGVELSNPCPVLMVRTK